MERQYTGFSSRQCCLYILSIASKKYEYYLYLNKFYVIIMYTGIVLKTIYLV